MQKYKKPCWLSSNCSMIVTVKHLSEYYETTPAKIRRIIKKLNLTDNKNTASKYLYVFSSDFRQSELNQIHEELTALGR